MVAQDTKSAIYGGGIVTAETLGFAAIVRAGAVPAALHAAKRPGASSVKWRGGARIGRLRTCYLSRRARAAARPGSELARKDAEERGDRLAVGPRLPSH